MKALASPIPDEVRKVVLDHLYAVQKTARGVRASGKKFRDIASVVRQHGYKQQDVAAALNYLKDAGWVIEEVTTRQFRTSRGTLQDAQQVTYRIAQSGIDRVEGGSVFQHNPEKLQGINVSNVGGVVVIGDNNIVRTKFADVSKNLDQLAKALEASTEVDDETKVEVAADLGAIRSQLAKREPDKGIIAKLWQGAERLATVSDLTQLVQMVGAGLAAANLLG